MATFGITTAKEFLDKLHAEQADFEASHYLSARHALNAIITAYHMHEWVWGECRANRPDLLKKWGLVSKPCAKDFEKYLIGPCPGIEDARKVTNGTKHFGLGKIKTGAHGGGFSRGFSTGFDVSHLWIERDQKREDVKVLVGELVTFWDTFFNQNGL
jgi:hypothetical protein